MSGESKQTWGQQRAVWDVAKEHVLLELFHATRQEPKLRTERGLKVRGWETIPEQINKRCSTTFNVDQLKSKYARLMSDYELFNDVGGERSLSDQAWDKLILDMPEHAKRLRQFKESGFPHVDICRRIALGREESTDKTAVQPKQEKPNPRAGVLNSVGVPTVVTVKRSSGPIGDLPDVKRARANVDKQPGGKTLLEEKVLLFLCWKAKVDREKSDKNGGKPVWRELTTELNQQCKVKFNEKQIMDKYLQLMQAYDQFKRATGFSGDLETAPKDNTDWEKLIQDRPQCSLELQHLKNKGGFPHVELCSLIAGDKSSDGMKPASLSEFLVTGSLQRLGAKDELNTESINAVATAQASLSADALAHLLPATMTPPPSSGKYVQPDPAEVAATTPAVLTQDLHDNMNMFLKTATAYLVMMINDHNHQNDK